MNKPIILVCLCAVLLALAAIGSYEIVNYRHASKTVAVATKATVAPAKTTLAKTNPATVAPVIPAPAPKKVVVQPPIPTTFVPILMYHYIRDYTDGNDPTGIDLSVSPATFQSQLQAMQAAGYHAITLGDYASKNYSGKAFVITFDDGYEDHYTDAFPILQQLGMKATFFIITDFVGEPNYMTRDQIDEMAAAGMEMGAHTLDHKDLAVLSYSEAYRQISGSLAGMAPVFAYPSGEYSTTTVSIVKNLGVKASVTTKENVATNLDNIETLPRVRVKEHTPLLSTINGLIYQLKHPQPIIESTP